MSTPGRGRLPPRAAGWAALRRRAVLAALLAGWLGASSAAIAQPEQHVKAAFVFNFVRFTEWPPQRFDSHDSPLYLCIWSGDPGLLESMKSLAGRSIDQRQMRVLEVDRPDDLGRCHALFIGDATPRGAAPGWLRRAESLGVLTMGDSEGFATAGGMIGLVSDGSRMRFEINDRAVKRSGLKLGSQLHQLGRGVTEAAAR